MTARVTAFEADADGSAVSEQRQQPVPADDANARHYDAVERDSADITAEESGPVAVLLLLALLLIGVALELLSKLLGQELYNESIDIIAVLDEERRCQRRDDGDGDDDRIDIVRNHAEGQAKARYDKGEFTDLRKRAAAVNSILQALPESSTPSRRRTACRRW